MKFLVSPPDADQSVLNFLKSRVPDMPSVKALKRAIESRCCKVNGKLELFASRRLRRGDTVEFIPPVGKSAVPIKPATEPRKSSTEILYEDDDLIAINKPINVVSDARSLQQYVSSPFWLVHRLDKDTTGILLLAKTQEAKAKLEGLFSTRQIKKTYLALVHGWKHEKEKTLSSVLVKESAYAGQTVYRSVEQGRGVRAITHFTLLQQSKSAALLQCDPLTGRTHQLRVQLAALGSPIIGDTQYGRRQDHPAIHRQMLHASELAFPHPRSGKTITITAPLPADFVEALRLFNLSTQKFIR